VFLAVDDDGSNLLIQEDKYGRQYGGYYAEKYQPPVRSVERVHDPTPIRKQT